MLLNMPQEPALHALAYALQHVVRLLRGYAWFLGQCFNYMSRHMYPA